MRRLAELAPISSDVAASRLEGAPALQDTEKMGGGKEVAAGSGSGKGRGRCRRGFALGCTLCRRVFMIRVPCVWGLPLAPSSVSLRPLLELGVAARPVLGAPGCGLDLALCSPDVGKRVLPRDRL